MSEGLKRYLETFWGKDEDRDINFIRKYNKELVDKYPWLKPYNVWTGKLNEDYDYEYTWLDDMPNGWRIAFGEQMCEEIQAELERVNYVNKYKILQIKEKFGGLRWYDSSIPTDCAIWDIITKYEAMSYKTCIICGAPATRITTGWICPYCDNCIDDKEYSVPVEEFYKK